MNNTVKNSKELEKTQEVIIFPGISTFKGIEKPGHDPFTGNRSHVQPYCQYPGLEHAC